MTKKQNNSAKSNACKVDLYHKEKIRLTTLVTCAG